MTDRNTNSENLIDERRGGRQQKRSAMVYVLWSIQALLAVVFLFAGAAKLVMPAEALQGPVAIPVLFLRFIGVCEVLGAFGLILPGLLRIRQELTPLAASGLVIIMLGATVVNFASGLNFVALITLAVGGLAAFVAYERRRLLARERKSDSRDEAFPLSRSSI